MKSINISFLTLLIIFSALKTEAQKERDCIHGKMNSKDENGKKICFTRDTLPYPGSYYTKYIIEVDQEEVFEIDFRVYKETDTILVQLFDKLRTKARSVYITYNGVNDCYSIIKDYHPNDKDINDTAAVSILFNIPNEEERYVYLNVIKDMSDETYYFLRQIPPDVRAKYDNCLSSKDSNCNKVITEFNNNEKGINKLKAQMNLYKENQLNKMKDEIEKKITEPATDKATPDMQEAFRKKMDNLFLSQFGNYFTFENNDIDVELSFNINGIGRLQNIGKNFRNGSQKKWFIDTIEQKIKPLLEKENVPILTGQYKNPDLIIRFNNSFNDSMYYYDKIREKLYPQIKKCDSTFQLPDNNQKAFDETSNNIIAEFTPFFSKSIGLPTDYKYNYRYTTTVSDVTGKWKNERNEFEIKSGTRSQDLIDNWSTISTAFKEKLIPSSRQRYLVKICTLKINGKFIGFNFQKLE